MLVNSGLDTDKNTRNKILFLLFCNAFQHLIWVCTFTIEEETSLIIDWNSFCISYTMWAMPYEMSQDLCVSWYSGNKTGTQQGDFVQYLLYIPGARKEVVSGERTVCKVLSRNFQQLFKRVSWFFTGIFCLKILDGFSYTVLQTPARYVVILGRRARGKEVLSYNVNWVYCCLAEYFGSLLWQSLCHKHFLALGTRSNH